MMYSPDPELTSQGLAESTNSYLTNVSLKFAGGAAGFVLSTVSSVIVARTLGVSGQGTFALVVLIPTMIASLSSLGISNANGYLVGSRKHAVGALVGNSISLTAILTTLTGLLFWLAMPVTIRFLSESNVDKQTLGLAFLIVPLSLMEMYLNGILLGMERIAHLSIVSIARFGSLLVLTICLVIVLRGGVRGALFATIGSTVLAVAMQFFFLRNDTKIGVGLDWQALRDSLSFGVQAHLGTVVQFLSARLDVFVLNLFAGPSDVGLYSVATTVAGLLSYFPQAFGFVLFPRTASSDSETARQFTPKVARLSTLVTVVAVVGMFAVSGPALTLLYGEEYRPSLRPLWVLLPSAVLVGFSLVLFSDLAGRGKPYYGTIASIVSTLVTVGGNLLLIPRLGIVGAAIAVLLSRSANATVAIWAYLAVSHNRFVDILLIRKSDVAVGLNLGSRLIRRLSFIVGRQHSDQEVI